MNTSLYPKLRPLQPVPIVHMGQPSYFLRDPLRLNGHTVVLPDFLAPLLGLCDGTHDLQAIASIFRQHIGLDLSAEDVSTFIDAFDQCCLLENERTQDLVREISRQYRAAPHREPVSADGVYPSDPARLSHLLNDYLEEADIEPAGFPGKGLLSPHIDYARGGEIYARVWKRAASMIDEADLFILIGTDHYGGHNPITLTRQHYATPYGVVPTNMEIIDRLAAAIGEKTAFAGELYHRGEHSLELPLVWLHHLTRHRRVEILPILCGRLLPQGQVLTSLLPALRTAAAGRKVFYIISGDLAHVGPAFGGHPLDERAKKKLRYEDQQITAFLESGDPDGFLDSINSTGDANNICGAYPLYLSMKAMGGIGAELTGYAQCNADEHNTSVVSVTGAVFY